MKPQNIGGGVLNTKLYPQNNIESEESIGKTELFGRGKALISHF